MFQDNQKKNNKIEIPLLGLILFIVLTICIIGTIIYTIIEANLLKTDKELFLENALKITEGDNSFISKELQHYLKLKSEEVYENKTKLDFDIDKSGIVNINNFNISSTGQIDKKNNNLEQNVVIEYSENNTFPLIYKKYGETVGVQTDNIGSKFVSTDIKKLNEYTDILGMMSVLEYFEVLNYITSIQSLNIEEGKKQAITNLVIDWFPDENYHTIKDGDNNSYRLSTNFNEIQDLIDEIYSLIKDDIKNESVKNILNDIKEKMYSEIENTEGNKKSFDITLNTVNKNINKIEIYFDDIKLGIEKNKGNEKLEYLINYEEYSKKEKNSVVLTDTPFILNLKISYEGINELNNIIELYQLEIDDRVENAIYTYNLENENIFIETASINDFNKDDTMFLNDKNNNEVEEFLSKVEDRLQSVNNENMEKLNLRGEENPLKYIVPRKILEFLSNEKIIENSDKIKDTDNEEDDINKDEDIESESKIELENENETEEKLVIGEEILEFNKKFENYQGTKQLGTTVKGLFTTIEVNNSDPERIGKISEMNFDGQEYELTMETMNNLKNEIVLDATYKVEYEKEESGMIFRTIIIKEQDSLVEEQESEVETQDNNRD